MMISDDPLKSIRLILALGCALMQCSCSRVHELKGEIFIVTAGHESVKLGLVEVRAFQPSQLNSLIDSVKKGIAEQDAQLEPISKEAEKLESSAKQKEDEVWSSDYRDKRFSAIRDRAVGLWVNCGDLTARVKWHSEYLHSAGPFFEALPRPIATSKSDSGGKFTMKLPRSGEIVICATAGRKLLNSTELYYWMVKATPSADAAITLSNDNLATSDSPQSLIHAATDSGVKAKSIEDLKTELNKLENEFHTLESDFVAAGQIPSASPSPSEIQATDTSPKTVTLKQAVSFQLQYGSVVVQPGTQFEIISRDDSEVHVMYMGSEQAIPISAVDFK
jgi:hypothetical protein